MQIARSLQILAFGSFALVLLGFTRRAFLIQEFNAKDDKGANGFAFTLPDGLEPLHGTGSDVTGTINFNQDDPSKSTGNISIGMSSLRLTSDQMTENMKGEWCLDVAKYPRADFVVKSAKILSKKENQLIGELKGDLTVKGVTKPVTVTGDARYVKGGIKPRFGDKEGDLLLINAKFSFKRSDFEIAKGALSPLVVSDKVDVEVRIASMAFKK
jgi:polyisoprenoid-binding protein YceI